MAEQIELKASPRPRVGKGAARGLRKTGQVPGVIYGDKREAEPIMLPYPDVWKVYSKGRFLSTVLTIDVGGTKTRVIPREVQVDPVMDFMTHVDFQRISANAKVRVGIPVHFLNHDKAPGLKRGGVLNVVRYEVELYCPSESIPGYIEIDLEGREIGDSIHISAVKLPEGVTPVIRNRDFTVATIAGAMQDKAEAAPGADAAATPAAGAAAAPAADAKGGKDAGKAPAKAAPAKAAPAKAPEKKGK